jgi:hypothetical protein
MKIELKPCPMCGCKELFTWATSQIIQNNQKMCNVAIKCRKEGCQFEIERRRMVSCLDFYTIVSEIEEVSDEWNRTKGHSA